MTKETKKRGLIVHLGFTGLMIIFSMILTMAAGEILLRIVYRDAGTTTMKGPGGESFIHAYSSDIHMRGPRAMGPKKPGVDRILILGDSITFGWGISEWKDIYAHRLLKMLNKDGEKFEIFTDAYSGREINDHLDVMKKIIDDVDPDIVVYQWYVNDLEIIKERKGIENKNLFWRAFPFHSELKKLSYLYYFFDSTLAIFISSSDMGYEEAMLIRYGEKTHEWDRFRFVFHEWASIATSRAKRTILMLYPHPPIIPDSPLKSFYERMKKICGPNVLSFPGYASLKSVGHNMDEPESYYGKVRKTFDSEHNTGSLARWQNIYIKKGGYKMTFRLKTSDVIDTPIATIEIKSHGKIIARQNVSGSDFTQQNKWQEFTIPFVVTEKLDKSIEFEVIYLGGADLSLERVQLPVDYGIEVFDLTTDLTGFNSYVSLFDAHPNEKAHNIMAQALYRQITGRDL